MPDSDCPDEVFLGHTVYCLAFSPRAKAPWQLMMELEPVSFPLYCSAAVWILSMTALRGRQLRRSETASRSNARAGDLENKKHDL
jgi:hypothetical protein